MKRFIAFIAAFFLTASGAYAQTYDELCRLGPVSGVIALDGLSCGVGATGGLSSSIYRHFTLTLSGNVTLSVTNMLVGLYVVELAQDAIGGSTVAFSEDFVDAPDAIVTTANDTTRLTLWWNGEAMVVLGVERTGGVLNCSQMPVFTGDVASVGGTCEVTVVGGGGEGSGDFSTDTATSVDSEVVLFSGTSGKVAKRAGGSGIAKLTSGVLSAVTAPSGTIVGTTDTQTLTNKTISGASNTLVVREADLSFTDITTGDVTTSVHGLVPKAPNSTAQFLRGDATWAIPPGAGDLSSNTATSVDSELVLFSSTTGKLAKRATGTGLVTATSGVYGTVTAPSGTVVGTSDTQTLTAKRITPRTTQLTDDATVSPNGDTTDLGFLSTLSQTTTINTPSGTPVEGQSLILRITSSVSRTLNWGAGYSAGAGIALPTATTGGGTVDYFGFRYNAVTAKFELVATTIPPS